MSSFTAKATEVEDIMHLCLVPMALILMQSGNNLSHFFLIEFLRSICKTVFHKQKKVVTI
jgi:hypothetical protein